MTSCLHMNMHAPTICTQTCTHTYTTHKYFKQERVVFELLTTKLVICCFLNVHKYTNVDMYKHTGYSHTHAYKHTHKNTGMHT